MEREFEETRLESVSHHESEMRKLEAHYRDIVDGLEREVQYLRMQDEPRIVTPKNDRLKAESMLIEEFQTHNWQLKSLKDQYEAEIEAMRYENQLDLTKAKEENNNHIEALMLQIALLTNDAEKKEAIISEMKSKLKPELVD